MNTEIQQKLIAELDLGGIPEKAQEEVISQLSEIILKSLVVAIYEKLSPEEQNAFGNLSLGGDERRMKEFVEQHIPNVHEMLEEEVKTMITAFKTRS